MKFPSVRKKSREESRKIDPYFSYLLLMLCLLASSGFSIRTIFKIVSETNINSHIRDTFRKVVYLVERWNYELREACRLVSRQVKSLVGGLLNRIANALDLGVEPRDYFPIEYETYMSIYVDEYERRIERMRRIADAYSAIISATTFLSITVILLMTMYGSETPAQSLTLMLLGVLTPLTVLTFLAYRTMPTLPAVVVVERPISITVIENFSIFSIPLCALLAFVLFNVCGLSLPYSFTLSLAVPGCVVLTVGLVGMRVLRLVRKVCDVLPTFIRSFCDAYEVAQSIVKALDILKMHDYGVLNSTIRRMYEQAKLRVDIETMFRFFVKSTLSERARVVLEILKSCILSGASIREAGRLLTSHMITELNLSRRREQIAGYLAGLVIPLEAVQAVIAGLTIVLLTIFNKVMTFAQQIPVGEALGIPTTFLSIVPVDLVCRFYMLLILVTCILTSFMLYVARGEAKFLISYYLGILLLICAACFQATYMLMLQALSMMLGKIGQIVIT